MKKEFTAAQTKALETLEQLAFYRDQCQAQLNALFPGIQLRISFYGVPVEKLPPTFTADILGDEYLINSAGALSSEPNLREQKCFFSFTEVKGI